MSAKKILYLMEYPIDLPGGAQLSTIAVCEALAEDSAYEPVVVCPNLINGESRYKFRVVTYPMGESRIKNLLIRIGAFKRIIKEEAPDLIHIEMSESLITYGFIRSSFKNIKYIYTDRGMYFGYRLRSRIFMMPVLKASSMLVTTTKRNAALWEENSTIRPIEVIHNTIGGVFEHYDESMRKKDGEFTIGFAGRICVEKDWEFVPVLVRALHEAGLEFKVDLVLSMYEKGDAEQAAELRKGIIDCIGEDKLIYREELTQSQMSDYYYGLDLFVMTSRFESFGKAAVEAMSRGCAVIATGVGGLPEVIGDDKYIYSKEDPGKAVGLCRLFAGDKEALRQAQEYFLKRYRENFTPDKYINRHKEIYAELDRS